MAPKPLDLITNGAGNTKLAMAFAHPDPAAAFGKLGIVSNHISRNNGGHPSMAIVTMLGVISTLAGPGVTVQAHASNVSWHEHLVWWGLIVAPPGSCKSSNGRHL